MKNSQPSHHHPHRNIDTDDHDEHNHDHDTDHATSHDILMRAAAALHLPGYGHSHDLPGRGDPLIKNELGIRTVKLALLSLGITTLLQLIIYAVSGSVALLADTIHNLGDALNSVPLLIAFILARRSVNRRYNFGYRRAEDIAGLLIVFSIAFSAAYIFYEAVLRLIHPEPLTNLTWVVAASLIGFLGNEIVAIMQITVGKQIGSEALVTDGRHARVDGLTSLSVLVAAIGTWLGFPILDPIIGLLISITIIFITRDAVIAIWYRLMDAVDPNIVEQAESIIKAQNKIKFLKTLRMRWVGHGLFIEAEVGMSQNLSIKDSYTVIETLSRDMYQRIPNLENVLIAQIPQEKDREG